MAPPSRAAFSDQLDNVVGDSIGPFDLSAGWDANGGGAPTRFEVLALPPGFQFDGTELTGTFGALMDYFIAVRASNTDGFSDWVESRWTVGYTGGQPSPPTFRKLFGLRWDAWPDSPQLLQGGTPDRGLIFFGAAALQNTGSTLINDIPADGTASPNDAGSLKAQILVSGDSSTYLRATAPGWEIIIDTAPVAFPLV